MIRSALMVLGWLVMVSLKAEETLDRIRNTQTIKVAYRAGQAPFSMRDQDQQVVGYAVEICSKIVSRVQRELKLPQLKLVFVPVNGLTRFSALRGRTADMECGTTSNNAERRQQFAFTIPYFIDGVKMIVRRNSDISNWTDLKNRSVVTVQGTAQSELVKLRNYSRVLDMDMHESLYYDDAMAMLVSGKVAALAGNEAILHNLMLKIPDPSSYLITGNSLAVKAYAVMLRKSDLQLKAIADAEMVRLINDGEIYKIYNKWFVALSGPGGQSLNLPMSYFLRDSFRYPSDKVGE